MLKQWFIPVGLVIVIVVLGMKIVQLSVVRHAPPPLSLWFSCAVAVDHQVGELCVRGPSGVSIDGSGGCKQRVGVRPGLQHSLSGLTTSNRKRWPSLK